LTARSVRCMTTFAVRGWFIHVRPLEGAVNPEQDYLPRT